MGDVVPFRKPLSITPSFHEGGIAAVGMLAEEIYNQCRIHAMAEAFIAKRENPALEMKRLVPSLTELFAEEVLADKVLHATIENNPEKMKLAAELLAVIQARHNDGMSRRAP